VRGFRYALDPLCALACVCYALNEWILKPAFSDPFLHGHFNDFWLIPAALPPTLWLQRKLRLRRHDAYPGLVEIGAHTLLWSAMFEVVGPRMMRVTGDPWDVAAYVAGAALAAVVWRRAESAARADSAQPCLHSRSASPMRS
jgi:hypothetical protein